MIQIIAGKKGKGKTKYLLAGANERVEKANGSIVYIDKNGKHMYELSNKVRLINVAEYPIRSYNAFVGFVCGIISQDHDLEELYFDSFLKIAGIEEGTDLLPILTRLAGISEAYNVKITISISVDEKDIPEEMKSSIIVSL